MFRFSADPYLGAIQRLELIEATEELLAACNPSATLIVSGTATVYAEDRTALDAILRNVAPAMAVTASRRHYLKVGDRIRLPGDSNRIRRRVSAVTSETSLETTTYLRPSKGFRRHRRRAKTR